ncbi:nucleotide disphospho-sugar-binding domain-containing protein [Streptomyces sp. ST2-7A]|uniref:nucleotide disphospho-sugar-binding domain-containing protein n=1 Tax=Streptomyces sp. ST2-7A TaxID=2907214 RepID=UPI001F3C6777|nr:nucleotide disphospho-sugar-binding domain-containing protein [Streptomyces sp. ST2-7A]MCE7082457.1 DUF1205 domain-containing protein [Streptomyces sp. ST2-7A]
MRVLFTVSNWATHWSAMVPHGWALQAAGHEVRVMCAGSQSAPAAHAGLTPVPVLEAVDMPVRVRVHNYLKARAGEWPFTQLPPHPETGRPLASLDDFDLDAYIRDNTDLAAGIALRSADAAVTFARAWRPDLVVHDQMSLEGPLVGRVLEVPAVLALWGPLGPDDRPRGVAADGGPGATFLPTDRMGVFRRHGAGVDLTPEIFEHVVDPSPASVAPPLRARRLPARYVPYNGSGSAPGWLHDRPLRSGRPRVCVVWGTSVRTMYGDGPFPVPAALAALAGAGAEVTVALAAADRARLGELPDHTRLVENVPLHLLLAGADLVVHHGGGGCTMTALAAGVPQLTLPLGLDQEVIADRLAAAGAARTLHCSAADATSIADSAKALLTDPAYRSAARELAREMAGNPSPAALVASLEELALAGS